MKALARRGRVDRLAEAATYQELVVNRRGEVNDLGAPIRESAVVALGRLSSDEAIEATAAALGDRNDHVQVTAIAALRDRGDAFRLARGLHELRRGTGQARSVALSALDELRDPGAVSPLVDSLLEEDSQEPLDSEEQQLVRALLDEGEAAQSTAVIGRLVHALDSPSEVVSARAEDLLVAIGESATHALTAELRSGSAPHRAAAALGRLQDLRAVSPLVEALDHGDSRTRAMSCAALGELRDPAAVEPLLRAARDPEHLVRAAAGRALDQIGAVAVVVGVAAVISPMLNEIREAAGSPLRRLARFVDRIEHAREQSEPG